MKNKRDEMTELILMILILIFGFLFGYTVNYRIYKVEQRLEQTEEALKEEIQRQNKRIRIDSKQKDILKVEPTDEEIIVTIGEGE